MDETLTIIQALTSSNILIIIALTYFIVEGIKNTNKVHIDYIPIAALFIGAVIGLITGLFTDLELFTSAVIGILSGGFSAGLYDAIKGIKHKQEENSNETKH